MKRWRFALPDLGEGLRDAVVTRWMVSVGDSIDAGHLLVEVETAKSVLAIPVSRSATVQELLVEEGNVVEVGQALATLVSREPARPDLMRVGYGSVAGEPPEGRAVAPRFTWNRARRTASTRSSGIQRAAAQKFASASSGSSAVTIWMDVDASNIAASRSDGSRRIGFTALIATYAVRTLSAFAALNSSLNAESGNIDVHSQVNLGIAVDGPHGVIVPAVPNAGELDRKQLALAVEAAVKSVKEGLVFSPGIRSTFTLNNFGRHGVDGATPILNYPEVAMLGVGRMVERPWVVAGLVEVRPVLTLTLTFDHRACSADVASGFLRHVAGLIEE